jgi:myosin-1
VLSADGKYSNFTCLPTDAMDHIQKHGDLPFKCIKRRNVLSGPVSTLLNGPPEITKISSGNLLEQKLRFVADVVDQWIQGKGLGCRPEGSSRIRWNGPHLEDAGGKKVDYITVGRFGGDEADAAEIESKQ